MNMNMNMNDAGLGDVLRITEYKVGRMYTPVRSEKRIGQEVMVIKKWEIGRAWTGFAMHLRVLATGETLCWNHRDAEFESYELVRKGDGTPIVPGVSYPFTEDELKQQRFRAFQARVLAHDQTHQGFANAATYLAHLYLANEPRFVRALPDLRRKDGTINQEKVRKAFGQYRLKVDDWAFECPIEVPAEFAGWRVDGMPSVFWQDVADSFAASRD